MGIAKGEDAPLVATADLVADAQWLAGDAVRPLHSGQADLLLGHDFLSEGISVKFERRFYFCARRGLQSWSVGEGQLFRYTKTAQKN